MQQPTGSDSQPSPQKLLAGLRQLLRQVQQLLRCTPSRPLPMGSHLSLAPLPDPPPLTYVEMTSAIELEWQSLPKGQICDYLGLSVAQQGQVLLELVTSANHSLALPQGRCAIIDTYHLLSSARWKMLSASGLNWLVRPDTLYGALQTARFLLSSQKFALIMLVGVGIHDLHQEDVALLQAAITGDTTLLLVPDQPTDGSGEPLAPGHCA